MPLSAAVEYLNTLEDEEEIFSFNESELEEGATELTELMKTVDDDMADTISAENELLGSFY